MYYAIDVTYLRRLCKHNQLEVIIHSAHMQLHEIHTCMYMSLRDNDQLSQHGLLQSMSPDMLRTFFIALLNDLANEGQTL